MIVAVRGHNLYSWTIPYKLYKLLKKLSKSSENFIKRYRCKCKKEYKNSEYSFQKSYSTRFFKN